MTVYSRRGFGRLAAMISAGATLPLYNEFALAQYSRPPGVIPPDAVKIDANENPLGPCPDAIDAIQSIVPRGGAINTTSRMNFAASWPIAKAWMRRTSAPTPGRACRCTTLFSLSPRPSAASLPPTPDMRLRRRQPSSPEPRFFASLDVELRA